MRRALPWLLSFVALGSVGCNGDLPAQLRACGLVTDGELPRLPLYAPNDCYRECLGAASCESLEEALCRTDLRLLIACDARCAFACDSGELIPVERVCDGNEQCEGGEDERDCPVYVCDDGQELVGSEHRCDGYPYCGDGSDEAGCPMFPCGDGETVPTSRRCDGWSACADGSDEEGCAELVLDCDG